MGPLCPPRSRGSSPSGRGPWPPRLEVSPPPQPCWTLPSSPLQAPPQLALRGCGRAPEGTACLLQVACPPPAPAYTTKARSVDTFGGPWAWPSVVPASPSPLQCFFSTNDIIYLLKMVFLPHPLQEALVTSRPHLPTKGQAPAGRAREWAWASPRGARSGKGGRAQAGAGQGRRAGRAGRRTQCRVGSQRPWVDPSGGLGAPAPEAAASPGACRSAGPRAGSVLSQVLGRKALERPSSSESPRTHGLVGDGQRAGGHSPGHRAPQKLRTLYPRQGRPPLPLGGSL